MIRLVRAIRDGITRFRYRNVPTPKVKYEQKLNITSTVYDPETNTTKVTGSLHIRKVRP